MRVAELRSSRDLLWNLTLRELRGKYKRSALGWAWSMLNPLATMLVYTFVFAVVLPTSSTPVMAGGRQVYALFLLCALLPWNFLAGTTGAAMSSLVGNAGLIRKVWFPREVLVFAISLSLLVSFGIEIGLLSVALLVAGNFVLPWLPVLVLLAALLLVLGTGIGLVLAALNVYFRDISYLWSIFLQLWFFGTPIVYPVDLVEKRLSPWLFRLYEANPMAVFASCFRKVLYDLTWPSAGQLLYLTAVSVSVLLFGLWLFERLSPRFAEEL